MKLEHASTNRLEAFSDGVIAVIVTIMVLELRVPHGDGWRGFAAVVPWLSIYLLSFAMVAIYWVNHHELCRRTEKISFPMVWANMGWLFSLSLIPFFTEYIGEKHFDAFSTALYGVIMVLTGGTYGLLRMSVVTRQKQSGTFEHADQAEARKHAISLIFYAIAIPIALKSPHVALLLYVAVALLWMTPAFGTHTECEADEHPQGRSR
ncbi:MAG: DUF1211 domain-containing protein [Acidobacteria bacterium]|nr:DUF1211 domain-containing protein [Acidobacteriota bacterium]